MTPIWDVNVAVGRPLRRSVDGFSDPNELQQWMGRVPIERVLIWHYAQYDCAPDAGNTMVTDWTCSCPQTAGCWTLMPSETNGDGMDLLESMAAHRMAALRAFPLHHNFMLNRVACGAWLDMAVERSIPLLLSLQRGVGWEEVYTLLSEFPGLTVVLCDIGVWSALRYLWPLMRQYPNVYVESSQLSLTMGALEETVRRYGMHRVLFGSGYPERYLEASLLDLLHADISDTSRQAIAWDNACRLFGQPGTVGGCADD